MANDRIFLVCNKCGAKKLLYKYYPSPTSAYVWPSQGKLNDFIAHHIFECDNCWANTLGGDPKFHLETESKERGLNTEPAHLRKSIGAKK